MGFTKWTEEEDDTLTRMRRTDDQVHVRELMKAVGRTKSATIQRLKKLAREGRITHAGTGTNAWVTTTTPVAATPTVTSTWNGTTASPTRTTDIRTVPMIALVGSRQEITDTLRSLFN